MLHISQDRNTSEIFSQITKQRPQMEGVITKERRWLDYGTAAMLIRLILMLIRLLLMLIRLMMMLITLLLLIRLIC